MRKKMGNLTWLLRKGGSSRSARLSDEAQTRFALEAILSETPMTINAATLVDGNMEGSFGLTRKRWVSKEMGLRA
jgi:hypothetical protein